MSWRARFASEMEIKTDDFSGWFHFYELGERAKKKKKWERIEMPTDNGKEPLICIFMAASPNLPYQLSRAGFFLFVTSILRRRN